ncbi:MAG: glycosyltransferase family 4 protein [candidate division Zixibacteria bacterium]|nr:glycosyltransferase family 4 protein [candidate division Zixibacteria bacterium]
MSKVIDKKIKVLQIITRLIIGGAQEHMIYLCDLLDKKRFSVKILSGAQTARESDYADAVRKKNIKLILLPQLTREINPLRDFLALFRMVTCIKRERFDIVHTNSSKAGILGRLAARLAGVPVIVHTAHGWAHHDYMGNLRRKFYVTSERAAEKFTDKIIAVSEQNVDKALKDKIGKRSKYCIIRSGIDLEKFNRLDIDVNKEKRKLNIDPKDKVVGSVTRLFAQKSPGDFIGMANEILKNNSRVSFLLVGDGPLKQEIETMIAEYKIAEKVILTGFRSDIPELLSIIDVFVLTSLWEGLPRVLPQAMAMGIPIVATCVDGVPEAVKHGQNGFLVPPKDFRALAQRTLQLIENPSLAKIMGEAGKKMVYPEFCVKEMVRKTEKLYEELFNLKSSVKRR